MPPARPPDAWLGLDVGTSAVKALLVDAEGAVRGEAVAPLTLCVPEPLAAEQDAEAWWRAAATAVRACRVQAGGLAVRGVGLTGQKHALVALDDADRPLAPAVLWADGRAFAECDEVRNVFPAIGRRTGALPLPGFLVPKWLRFLREDPARAARVRRLVFAKDFVRLKLTGGWATERTEASASQVYDFRSNAWSPTLLRFYDIPAEALAPVGGSTEVLGAVGAAGARATGLDPGTPVVGGAGDNEAGAVACGALGRGRVAITLGTSGTVVAYSRVRGAAGGLSWCRHVLPGGYAATGTVLSAGRALRWVGEAAFPAGGDEAAVVAAAEAADPTAAPLVFLPALVGERSPVPDPLATACFVGLRPSHGRGHLARAVLDGVTLALAETITLLRAAGVEARTLRVTSGGAASGLWRRTLASAAQLPVTAVSERLGPALGAAILAAVGTGAGPLEDLAEAWVRPGAEDLPDRAESERLAALAVYARAVRTALRGVGAPGDPRRRPREP